VEALDHEVKTVFKLRDRVVYFLGSNSSKILITELNEGTKTCSDLFKSKAWSSTWSGRNQAITSQWQNRWSPPCPPWQKCQQTNSSHHPPLITFLPREELSSPT